MATLVIFFMIALPVLLLLLLALRRENEKRAFLIHAQQETWRAMHKRKGYGKGGGWRRPPKGGPPSGTRLL